MISFTDKTTKLSLLEIASSPYLTGEQLLTTIEEDGGALIRKFYGIKVPFHENDLIRLFEADFDDNGYVLTEYTDFQDAATNAELKDILGQVDANGDTLAKIAGVDPTDDLPTIISKVNAIGFEFGEIIEYAPKYSKFREIEKRIETEKVIAESKKEKEDHNNNNNK